MGTIIRGNKADRVVGGAILGAVALGLDAWRQGKDARLAALAGALALGSAQANHRLAARGAGSTRNEKWARALVDVAHALKERSTAQPGASLAR